MGRPFFSKREWRVLALWARVGVGATILSGAMLLLTSLVTYDSADPGWYRATWREPANWLGGSGAMLADVLVRTFGLAGFGLAALGLVWGARLLVDRRFPHPLRRLLAAPVALIAGAAFASSHAGESTVGGGLGGLLGDFVFGVLATGLPLVNDQIRLIASTLLILTALIPTAAYALGARLEDFTNLYRRTRDHVTGARRLPLAWGDAGRRGWRRILGLGDFFGAVFAAPRDTPVWVAEGPLTAPPTAPRASGEPGFARRRETRPEAGLREPEFRAPEPREPSFSAAEPEPEDPAADEPLTLSELDSLPAAGIRFSAMDDEPDQPAPKRAVAPLAALDDDDTLVQNPFVDDHAYTPPPLGLLTAADADDAVGLTEEFLAREADRLQAVLQDYGVKGDIVDVHPGPVVSQFELEPAPGLKAARVIGLADDIARSMSATAARISTIPGRNVIGIELPNPHREIVRLSTLLDDPSFRDGAHALPLALGKDIAGAPVVADLAAMPHLLIAGTTGSGKSVAINTMLLSLLYRMTPEQVRLILIDPKMLELSIYDDAPHLLAPVVTEPKKAVAALKWLVREMEDRYRKMSRLNVRSLESYNRRVAEAGARDEPFERTVQTGFDEETDQPVYETQRIDLEPMPYIVVVIDEMADLMLSAGKEIEHCIQRLAQMARAAGIHLIMATQRPSVDVITGVIKANFPIRISFQVTSKIDSRTILGEPGAEQLLGRGDMLFASGGGRLQRIHGPFVSDQEVGAVARHLRRQGAPRHAVDFDAPEPAEPSAAATEPSSAGDTDEDLYQRAAALVRSERRASTSLIQRRLQIGYNRAARIIEMMEQRGVISGANHVGKREVLIGAGDRA